jgi:hypothetical protein
MYWRQKSVSIILAEGRQYRFLSSIRVNLHHPAVSMARNKVASVN